nr:hypothetical protein BHI3_11940 [Bacteriovorax sp. HI3]
MKTHLLSQVTILGVIIVILLIRHQRQKSRKNVDLYGFFLPQWTLLNDKNKILEIENDFKSGIIAAGLMQYGLDISGGHSHQQHSSGKAFSGFIKLESINGFIVVQQLPNEIFHRTSNFSRHRKAEYRYFQGKTSTHYSELSNIDSYQNKFKTLNEEVNLLDQFVGQGKWHIVIFGDKYYLLAPEIFKEEEIKRFLEIGLSLQAKI